MRRCLAVGVLVVLFSVTSVGAAPPVLAQPIAGAPFIAPFIAPVDAPIADPYRPPANPYGPGNRGIEYDTEPGQPVWASGGGIVAFAGVIAYERYVSIDHGAGLRTTYSYLATIEVEVGQAVVQGERIGAAGERFHFGVRRDGAYIDPALLFALARPAQARLVPAGGVWR